MTDPSPILVEDYIAQVSQAVNAIREARGEPEVDEVSKAEFSAHSLAAVLCASGGRFIRLDSSSPPRSS
mgnify:CR=1 FL=1